MSRVWEQIEVALDFALEEIAAAESMQLIPREAEQHWRMALCYFLRCVEICSEQQHAAQERERQG